MKATEYESLTLNIPTSMNYQMIYRQELHYPINDIVKIESLSFSMCDGPSLCLKLAPLLIKRFGIFNFIKTLLKTATPTRDLALIIDSHNVVFYCWASISKSSYYLVEKNSVVLNTMVTDPNKRGQGIAPLGLKMMMNHYFSRGKHTFYIDTSKDNPAAQRVFAKSGFDKIVGSYPRK